MAAEPSPDVSYVRGADQPPLREDTIGAALDEAARRWGEREAVVSVAQGVRWTFAELAARADAVAAGLLALGLTQGERIGIWSPNNAEWVLTQFAAAKAGLILVTINPAYRASELEYTLNKVGVKALVAACAFKTSNYAEMVEALAPEIAGSAPGRITAAALPHLRAVIKIGGSPRSGWLDFDAVAGLGRPRDAAALKALAPSLRNNEAINIQFTSGTTGLPKGATLSHRNILNNGYFLGFAIGLREGDRLC
ncbi:MAG TPA: AMP-binding protein, partial [Caulobacteraceae bacterium]